MANGADEMLKMVGEIGLGIFFFQFIFILILLENALTKKPARVVQQGRRE